MKTHKPKFYSSFIIFFFLLTSTVAWAQREEAENACAKTLRNARNIYDQGRIEEVPGLIKDCLEHGFNDIERIEAYKLLIMSYLYNDDNELAEQAMLEFLKIEPEYKINTVVDPTEFINLYNMFRTTPIFYVGGKAGGNLSFVNVHQNYSLDNTQQSQGTYKSKLGYQAGIVFNIPINSKWSISPELNFIGLSYEFSKKQLGYSELLFSEDQMWGELPLFLRYTWTKGKWSYYVQAGGSVSYLLSAKATVERTDSVNIEVGNRSVSGPSIDLTDQREKLSYNALLGAGLMIKGLLGNGYLLADVRASYGIPNIVNSETRYDNNELQYQYLYLDNDFSLNDVYLSIGYVIPIYKPKIVQRKKRKALKQ